MRCDKSITAQRGKWIFDKKVVQSFDSHVRKSTPYYDQAQSMVCSLADWFIGDNSIVYDLGASTGNTIKQLAKRNTHKNIRYILIDSSEDMLKHANKTLHKLNNKHFAVENISLETEISNASLVLCLYTLQFIKPEYRQQLINRVYEGLKDGGAFILIDKIVCEHAAFDNMYTEIYHDLKRDQGLTSEQIENKAISLRGVLRPYTLEKNFTMLREAGFKEVEVFFRWFNFVGIIAIK